MKIAIIGTRGIPNNYGGFEQLAEFLSVGLTKKGHTVYVYNSHNHSYQKSMWQNVNIIHKYDPEFKIGTIGQFIYDLNCILDSRKKDFDVILNLGYTSSSIWSFLFPKKSTLITNMDGLEWKRTKFSNKVKRFLMFAEKLAVKNSDALVADSLAIKKYIEDKYQLPSHFIAYGAELFTKPNLSILNSYEVNEKKYFLLIARMEPENNIEIILDGFHQSHSQMPFLVIGKTTNDFGSYLVQKYKNDKRIIFLGAIYDIDILNNLRHYCLTYFHGHSVGGTNPSLLEAMACNCLIMAHNNEFNKAVLENDGLYFSNSIDVKNYMDSTDFYFDSNTMIKNNSEKISTLYSWNFIINQYENLMLNSI